MMRAKLALLALVALAGCRAANRDAAAKPELFVLTSLPLLFDEGFGLEPAKGEAATVLRERYRLRPIDLPSQLPAGATLLAAQPRALPAEALVALDAWVRGGGRLLLLADPLLEWPSKQALGDRLRPPVSFADTGLLGHWGVRLDAPETRGVKAVRIGGVPFTLHSPGTLVKTGGTCRIEAENVVARCTIGTGHVLILADADWLNIEALTAAGGDPGDHRLALSQMLETLGAGGS